MDIHVQAGEDEAWDFSFGRKSYYFSLFLRFSLFLQMVGKISLQTNPLAVDFISTLIQNIQRKTSKKNTRKL
jgi:hypothetical protein